MSHGGLSARADDSDHGLVNPVKRNWGNNAATHARTTVHCKRPPHGWTLGIREQPPTSASMHKCARLPGLCFGFEHGCSPTCAELNMCSIDIHQQDMCIIFILASELNCIDIDGFMFGHIQPWISYSRTWAFRSYVNPNSKRDNL